MEGMDDESGQQVPDDVRRHRAKMVFEMKDDIKRFGIFDQAKKLGINFGPGDISFKDFLLFTWIMESRGK